MDTAHDFLMRLVQVAIYSRITFVFVLLFRYTALRFEYSTKFIHWSNAHNHYLGR